MAHVDNGHDITNFSAVILGIISFAILIGLNTANPSNSEWLMAGFDTPTYFLSWEFFRSSPFWQFQLGANPNYGMDISSSIVFSDSLPLLALFFKILNPILPHQFQYNGLWLLGCFILQGYYSNKLLGVFIDDRLLWLN